LYFILCDTEIDHYLIIDLISEIATRNEANGKHLPEDEREFDFREEEDLALGSFRVYLGGYRSRQRSRSGEAASRSRYIFYDIIRRI